MWRILCFGLLGLLLSAPASLAWDTAAHRAITQAALDTLSPAERARLGAEAGRLVEIYCMYPDRLVEMEQFGFVRASPGPRDPAEIRVYCVRPDGETIHSATWDSDEDMVSLVLLFERIVRTLKAGQTAEAAQYMGTLSHFLADSLSPPHSVSPRALAELVKGEPLPAHTAIERGVSTLDLKARKPQPPGAGLVDSAQAILDRLNAAAEQNRKDLPATIAALQAKDDVTLNAHRRRAATAAAEMLADSLHALLEFSTR